MTITKRTLAGAALAALVSTAGATAIAAPLVQQTATVSAASHAEDFKQTMARAETMMAKDHAGVEKRLRAMLRAHAGSGVDGAKAEEDGLRQVHQIMADAEKSPEALAHLKVIIAAITAPQ